MSAQQVAKLILEATFQGRRPDGTITCFLWDSSRHHGFPVRSTVSLTFDRKLMTVAACAYKEWMPDACQSLSIENISQTLQDILIENYHVVAKNVHNKRISGSILNELGDEEVKLFSHAIDYFSKIVHENFLYIFPIKGFVAEKSYIGSKLFLATPDDLSKIAQRYKRLPYEINGSEFPPHVNYQQRTWSDISSWLGILAQNDRLAERWKSAVLGGLMTFINTSFRFQISQAESLDGYVVAKPNGMPVRFGKKNVPAIPYKYTMIRHEYLKKVDELIKCDNLNPSRKISCLNYRYKAWDSDDSVKYALNCMALDAACAASSGRTIDLRDNIERAIGVPIDSARLQKIIEIRGDIVHGRSPTLETSKKYFKYIKKYHALPSHDLELITNEVIRRNTFAIEEPQLSNPLDELRSEFPKPTPSFPDSIIQVPW